MTKRPRIILIGGTSHCGKSTLARSIGETLGIEVIATDGLAKHPGRPWKAAPEQVPVHVKEHYSQLAPKQLLADVLDHYRILWPRYYCRSLPSRVPKIAWLSSG